jgi:crotonobetainyl-CoA:carnitine CoA-transferase CaiB-like acyl-CoA transferase
MAPQNAGPLAGIKVIDLSTVVMGPYAAQILGDLGADVVKIESPNDTVRNGSFHRSPGMTALALNVNRNKRSVALNLKDDDRERALQLIESADALITNMRGPALERLGLGYEQVAARNPRLVYTHGVGFRSDSPQAGNAAYDETVQAASGLVDLANRVTGKPIYLPTILGDKVASLTIVYSTMAALLHQQRTGEGQYVEIPMTDTLLSFSTSSTSRGTRSSRRWVTPGSRCRSPADTAPCPQRTVWPALFLTHQRTSVICSPRQAAPSWPPTRASRAARWTLPTPKTCRIC